MKTVLRTALFFFFSAFLAACGDTGLDTTDAGSFIESVENMYNSVDGKEREDFAKFFFIAMNGRSDLITLSQLNSEEIPKLESFFKVLVSRKKPEEIQALHGMSAVEIVELGRNLKITYLDGRIQELEREIAVFKEAADFFQSYLQEADKVNLELPSEVEHVVHEDGRISELHLSVRVVNGSDRSMVALGRDESYLVVSNGDDKRRLDFSELAVLNEEGERVFENGGVPSATEARLKVVARVPEFGWSYEGGTPISVEYPLPPEPCLEGWERVYEAEDSFKRVFELERNRARLSRQMDETKA
ncbi:MAG: hypothetical protein LBR53_03300 [Deltaproteobacteria bacterium]|jgi:hypothetical protein|nr:hypothetical protein [Deltaproteobacteria bacterium]